MLPRAPRMFMTYLNTKFHITISNGALFTVIKSKAKENIHIASMSLFYHLQKVASTKDAYILRPQVK
jgi:hypothetical protein